MVVSDLTKDAATKEYTATMHSNSTLATDINSLQVNITTVVIKISPLTDNQTSVMTRWSQISMCHKIF